MADSQEAVAGANASEFGLGASIWTADQDRALALAAELESGVIAINEMVTSDPRMPFGGIKSSGFGRELGSSGPHEFANVKSVVLGS